MTEQRKLTTDEAFELTDRLAALARSELPLVPGLIALGEEFPAGPLRRSMIDLARSLEAGMPLESAIEGQGDRLPPQVRGLIKAGLRTGRLGELLGRFSIYASIGTDLRRRLRLSLAYPMITITVALVIFTFVCAVLVPQFEAIFNDFGLPVPLITRLLLEASHLFSKASPVLLALVALGVTAWVVSIFLATSRKRSFAGRLPIVGGVWRSTSLAEFFHLLALLIEGNVPLSEAVRLAGDGVQDFDLQRASAQVAREVDAGRGLADSMASASLFPRGFSHLLKWAEKPGSLSEVLHMIAEMFEVRARAHLTFAAAAASLVSMVIMLMGVVVVVLGLLLPLITLVTKLSG